MHLEWIEVASGVLRFGEGRTPVQVPALLWTRTPITYGHLADRRDGIGPWYPVTEVNHAEAVDIATRLGGRLPHSVEWEWMASGSRCRRWPWGEEPWQPDRANLSESGYGRVTPVGTHPKGATPDGLLDVAGNVWEWTSLTTASNGFVIRGGSYAAPPAYGQCKFVNAAPAELHSRGIGVRVVREL